MHKLCPSCRKKNADDTLTCTGCGADLTHVKPVNDGSGITMFGGPPQQVSIKPLEKVAAAPTKSYGDARADVETLVSGGVDHSQEVESELRSTHRPRKPWE